MDSVAKAYNEWSEQYDTNENKTRDLEAIALREQLTNVQFSNCLEIGCGTGKNTVWLAGRAKQMTCVDLSTAMLQKAKEKITSDHVEFIEADITKPWSFTQSTYELVTFSLVLEHIEDLAAVFEKTTQHLSAGGHVYIGELHPFKQYTGSKARFTSGEETTVVQCFNHHVSDFIEAASAAQLGVVWLKEYFDDNDRSGIPRILSIVFRKQ